MYWLWGKLIRSEQKTEQDYQEKQLKQHWIFFLPRYLSKPDVTNNSLFLHKCLGTFRPQQIKQSKEENSPSAEKYNTWA